MAGPPGRTVELLSAISSGDQNARNELFTIVYKELHDMAHMAMRKELPGNILQTTALIHETYLRLVPKRDDPFKDRRHFFSVAANAMRRILISEARRRRALKRGSGKSPVFLAAWMEPDPKIAASNPAFEDLENLDRALEKLAGIKGYQRMCSIVEMLFFAGMTQDETAEILGVSKGTVRRDWDFAKAWLQEEIRGGGEDGH